jgi:hypothetical protein
MPVKIAAAALVCALWPAAAGVGACSCADASLCQPLSCTKGPAREVFAFFTGNWSNLDFSTMTTAAAFTHAIDPAQLIGSPRHPGRNYQCMTDCHAVRL